MSHAQRVLVRELAENPEEGIEKNIALEDFTVPASVGPNEVLIEIRSASVGWVDLLMTSGQYQHVPAPPYTPGLEYAGVVAAVGSDATLSVGDRVLVDGFRTGPRSLGEYQRWGGWATHALAPADAVLKIPGRLDFDEACNLLGNYETAYHCLIARGRLCAGENVLVLGASGSTGLAAVQVAKLTGANVIATGRSDEKLAVVREHGADHVINTKTTASLRDAVRAVTGGKGVDVVYDGVGGELSVESMRCVAFGARFLIVGWASTPTVAKGKGGRGAPNVNVLPTNLIMMKGLDVLGCPTVISTVQDPSIRAPRLAQILEWAASGRIRPHVSHRFPLSEIRDAMRAKWRGDVVGGCVVHPC